MTGGHVIVKLLCVECVCTVDVMSPVSPQLCTMLYNNT